MEPLHQFIIDLHQFIHDAGYEISSSVDIDLITLADNKLIGYWPATIDDESFRILK